MESLSGGFGNEHWDFDGFVQYALILVIFLLNSERLTRPALNLGYKLSITGNQVIRLRFWVGFYITPKWWVLFVYSCHNRKETNSVNGVSVCPMCNNVWGIDAFYILRHQKQFHKVYMSHWKYKIRCPYPFEWHRMKAMASYIIGKLIVGVPQRFLNNIKNDKVLHKARHYQHPWGYQVRGRCWR